jgi:hypothetical protein
VLLVNEVSVGVTVALVAMLGTLFALSLLAGLTAVLVRVLPPEDERAAQGPAATAGRPQA